MLLLAYINTIRWDFYVHFTNISNFLCIGVMLASLIQTAKNNPPVLKRANGDLCCH